MSYYHFGVRIDTQTQVEVQAVLAKALHNRTGSPVLIFTPNPELLVLARRRPEFASILNQSTINIADGQGLVWMSGGKIPERVTGSDLVEQLLSEVAHNANDLQNGDGDQQVNSVGVVVKSDGLMSKTEITKKLQKRYPALHLQVIESGESFQGSPVIIISALGFPEQEQWVIEHKNQYAETRILIAAGATIDFLVGAQRRAPGFFRNFGVEWLWRLMLQPRRIKRICVAVIVFPVLTLWERLHFTKS